MDAEQLLKVGLPVSLGIIMFSLGLGLTASDFGRVLRRPGAFTVGAVNQLITLPLTAFILAILFNLPPALAVGMMILAFCPGGVTTNILTKLAKGDVALSVSLTAVISLLSILTVPILVAFFVGLFMGTDPVVDVSNLSLQMTAIVAVPVLLGMVVRKMLGGMAGSVERFFSAIATLLFVLIIGTAIYTNWDLFITNLPRLGPALVALNIILLFFGWASAKYLLMSSRSVSAIAIETGVQNGTLGIAVGYAIFGGSGELPEFALPSAVYGVIMYLVTLPFIFWRRMGRR